MQTLKNHWSGWKKQFTESFEMKEDHIESCLTEDSGRGWHAARVGKNWVCDSPLLSYFMGLYWGCYNCLCLGWAWRHRVCEEVQER